MQRERALSRYGYIIYLAAVIPICVLYSFASFSVIDCCLSVNGLVLPTDVFFELQAFHILLQEALATAPYTVQSKANRNQLPCSKQNFACLEKRGGGAGRTNKSIF